ncbi:MAG: PilZ domain-containing protein [Pyrinomonadaceae bacterium]|nr:PilZ domain-containing protein [Pyrinomonadaceae bacterium]
MEIEDRRKNPDRRTDRRYALNIDIEWEGLVGRQRGSISDISPLGCFILCSGEVENGETIKIFIPIADGMKVQLWGEVVNHVFEIGVGVKFIELNDSQKEFLNKLIESLGDN